MLWGGDPIYISLGNLGGARDGQLLAQAQF